MPKYSTPPGVQTYFSESEPLQSKSPPNSSRNAQTEPPNTNPLHSKAPKPILHIFPHHCRDTGLRPLPSTPCTIQAAFCRISPLLHRIRYQHTCPSIINKRLSTEETPVSGPCRIHNVLSKQHSAESGRLSTSHQQTSPRSSTNGYQQRNHQSRALDTPARVSSTNGCSNPGDTSARLKTHPASMSQLCHTKTSQR